MKRALVGSLVVCLALAAAAVWVHGSAAPPAGTLRIHGQDGLVTIHAYDVDRNVLLKELAKQLDFELFMGRLEATQLRLDLQRVPLQVALAEILRGERYATENVFDQKTRRHQLVSVTAGFMDERYEEVASSTPVEPAQRADDGFDTELTRSPPVPAQRPAQAPNEHAKMQDAPFRDFDGRAYEQAEAARIAAAEALRTESLAALDSTSAEVRADATSAVQPVKDGLKKLTKQAIHDPEELNRVLAIEQLAKGRGCEVTTALMAALRDDSPEVVLSALDGIARSRDYTLVDRVKELVKDQPDPEIQKRLSSTVRALEGSIPTWSGTDYVDREGSMVSDSTLSN